MTRCGAVSQCAPQDTTNHAGFHSRWRLVWSLITAIKTNYVYLVSSLYWRSVSTVSFAKQWRRSLQTPIVTGTCFMRHTSLTTGQKLWLRRRNGSGVEFSKMHGSLEMVFSCLWSLSSFINKIIVYIIFRKSGLRPTKGCQRGNLVRGDRIQTRDPQVQLPRSYPFDHCRSFWELVNLCAAPVQCTNPLAGLCHSSFCCNKCVFWQCCTGYCRNTPLITWFVLSAYWRLQ